MIVAAIDEAIRSGARLSKACELIGLPPRTIQRWRSGPDDDMRLGPKNEPGNKLSPRERQQVYDALTSPEYRDLSPKEVVPRLADEGKYLASESTMYRLLRQADMLHHRERSKPPEPRPKSSHTATGPNQVWSWDITYLKSAIKGAFYRLYMVEDVWSRKIVGWEVHERECPDLAAQLVEKSCRVAGVNPAGIVLHADNGGPMKGATMLATMQRLGIVPSFSRPRVSDDNPYSEALFRTLKYAPTYPRRPFASLAETRAWVASFVHWYNEHHLHSGIGFVTPADRHAGRDMEILAKRRAVYVRARRRHPERWSGEIRSWERAEVVHLNPSDDMVNEPMQKAA